MRNVYYSSTLLCYTTQNKKIPDANEMPNVTIYEHGYQHSASDDSIVLNESKLSSYIPFEKSNRLHSPLFFNEPKQLFLPMFQLQLRGDTFLRIAENCVCAKAFKYSATVEESEHASPAHYCIIVAFRKGPDLLILNGENSLACSINFPFMLRKIYVRT